MTDVVERIRKLRFVHIPGTSDLMEEACQEIERLRLTDAEREAIAFAAESFADQFLQHGDSSDREIAATLRQLLERLA